MEVPLSLAWSAVASLFRGGRATVLYLDGFCPVDSTMSVSV